MKKAARGWAVDLAAIVVGSALVACGLTLFTIPNGIAPGGVSGLATALASVAPLTVGVWTLVLNVPLIALGWWKLGLKPLVKTIVATLLLSLLIDAFTEVIPPYTSNPLLAAVLGGVLCGAGMGFIFLRGASTGGTDLVSMLLNRAFPDISMGTLLLCVDAAVVVFAVFVFRDIEVALYSIVTIFVTSKTIDTIMQGADHAKVIYVVTEHGEEMLPVLAKEIERGVTVVPAEGGYTRRQKQLLTIVTRRNTLTQTVRLVRSLDEGAFLFITDATEVLGEGFKEQPRP